MSILEQRITKNKKLFDVHEPKEGHLKRFQEKLQGKNEKVTAPPKRFYRVLRVAASILILLSVSFALFWYNNGTSNLFASETAPELDEINEYYAKVTEQKLAQIEELGTDDAEAEALKESAIKSLSELENETKQLEKEYFVSNKDKRVFGAIVSNYRVLASALDQVIQNLNDIQDKKSGIL